MFNTTHTATIQIPQGAFQVTSDQGPQGALFAGMQAAAGRVGFINWTQQDQTFARGTATTGAAVQINVA